MDIVGAVIILIVVFSVWDRINSKTIKVLAVSTAFSELIALLFYWGTTI